jgi:polyribonucleotide nucleotidyltransferase
MAMIKKSVEINGQTLTIETGRVAKQAGGAVLISMGESVVLVAATGSKSARPGTDFLPLTCEYRPNAFAAGRIPGGYFKREGRPGPLSILVARLMDRPMRPLFPKHWRAEIQLFAQPVSHDIENATDVLAVTGASCAAFISDIPFDGPIACVRVGRVNGEFIANPTKTQLKTSDFNMIVAATSEAITMVEGGMEQASEEEVVAALDFGFKACQPLIELQKEIGALCAKEKMPVPEVADTSALYAQVAEAFKGKVLDCFGIDGKHERSDALSTTKREAVAQFAPDGDDEQVAAVKAVYAKLVKSTMRNRLIDTGVRIDGRKSETVRQITVEVGVLPRVHGSALFTRGETQALVTTTLGTRLDEKRIDEIDEQGWSRFWLDNNIPS